MHDTKCRARTELDFAIVVFAATMGCLFIALVG